MAIRQLLAIAPLPEAEVSGITGASAAAPVIRTSLLYPRPAPAGGMTAMFPAHFGSNSGARSVDEPLDLLAAAQADGAGGGSWWRAGPPAAPMKPAAPHAADAGRHRLLATELTVSNGDHRDWRAPPPTRPRPGPGCWPAGDDRRARRARRPAGSRPRDARCVLAHRDPAPTCPRAARPRARSDFSESAAAASPRSTTSCRALRHRPRRGRDRPRDHAAARPATARPTRSSSSRPPTAGRVCAAVTVENEAIPSVRSPSRVSRAAPSVPVIRNGPLSPPRPPPTR